MMVTPARLIISIDIGTSTSAVVVYRKALDASNDSITAYVDRWPGQDHAIYDQKVPSALLYDKGVPIRWGAKAINHSDWPQTDDDLHLVKHFKLLLHSGEIVQGNNLPVPVLPAGVTIQQVYSDYMTYLVDHTERWLNQYYPNNDWSPLVEGAEVVIAHPGQWGEEQQKILEQAAIDARLVSRSNAESHVSFVEEGEASASYCLSSDLAFAEQFKVGTKFVVCDVGGSTSDISPYKVTKIDKTGQILVKELALPSCQWAGGVRVNEDFRILLRQLLRQVDWDGKEDEFEDMITQGCKDFSGNIKRGPKQPSGTYLLQVGGLRMNIQNGPIMIKKGKLALKEHVLERCFIPSIRQIVDELHRIVDPLGNKTLILCTGGFCENPRLKSKIDQDFGTDQGQNSRRAIYANPPFGKAVPRGGLYLQLGGRGTVVVTRLQRPWLSRLADFAKKFATFVTGRT